MTSTYRPWSLRELVTGPGDAAGALDQARRAIAETEPSLRAWVELVPDPAPNASGPLAGVPLGVKDIIDVAGVATRCGSALRADAEPARDDAVVVTAWRRAGAVPVGKTVTTEFAYFSPGPTDNPAAPGHTPGGSSSGSAAAVAAGHVPLALGSQTAGSTTRPASFCGVAALVMSHDAIPVTGVVGLSPGLDSHGVFAARVDDLALAFSTLTGEPDPAGRATGPPRLLLWDASAVDQVEPEMRAAVADAGARLGAAGATVEAFPEPGLVEDLTAAQVVVMAYEAARERAGELAVASRLSAQLAELLRRGDAIPDAAYAAARELVDDARARIHDILGGYDAVLGPAAPGPAPVGLHATGDPVCSRPWQALGLPVVTVPGRRSADGRPLGLQVIGAHGREGDVLATGCWVENALA